jgi:hypothetical protein
MMRFISCPKIVIKTKHEILAQGPRSLKNREAPESRINGLPKIRYNQKFFILLVWRVRSLMYQTVSRTTDRRYDDVVK